MNVTITIIIMLLASTTSATGQLYRLWAGGIIPYEIAPQFGPETIEQIHEGARRWTAATALTIRPRRSESDYVLFRRTEQPSDFCGSSSVGRNGGRQVILLVEHCGISTVLHELGHAIGLHHEHQRTDRDAYVAVDAPPGSYHYHGWKKTYDDPWVLGFPYNYRSIMHYDIAPVGSLDTVNCGGAAESIETVPFGLVGCSEDHINNVGTVTLSEGDVDRVQWMYREAHNDIVDTVISDNMPRLSLPVRINGTWRLTPTNDRFTTFEEYTVDVPETVYIPRGIQQETQVFDRYGRRAFLCSYDVYRWARYSKPYPRRYTTRAVEVDTWNEAHWVRSDSIKEVVEASRIARHSGTCPPNPWFSSTSTCEQERQLNPGILAFGISHVTIDGVSFGVSGAMQRCDQ